MGIQMLYGVGIREAIASNSLEKMKAVAAQAEVTLKAQGDIGAAYVELRNAIDALEGK
ncbi:DUF1843 domain-containing protein [uncultured Kordia sp.]|uniref:DUF1843 domain-containing protein n=1 Tax=uncultured Kordia sp. TaxID=507699 RepID=UPI00262B9D41|nr:DUF1843 domain-containing protein [uncultured Kordia sp.]